MCRPRRRVIYPLALLCVLCALGATVPAAAYRMEPDFYTLTEEFVSPHITWARPYAGGKIRALFIVPRGTAREVIEIAQRLDLDYRVVMTLSDTELGWTSASSGYAIADGISQEEMVAELRDALAGDYDVIVTGHLSWDIFPREQLYELMRKVRDGTGLVHSYQRFGRNQYADLLFTKPLVQDDYVAAGVPWHALPVWRDLGIDRVLELRQFGAGRMALLDQGTRKPRFLFLSPAAEDTDLSWREVHYEYYMSLAAKAIIWAARKDLPVRITEIGIGADSVARAQLAGTRLTAQIAGEAGALAADLVVRDEDGAQHLTRHGEVTGPTLSFDLAPLPAGNYFADLWLTSGGQTVAWGSTAFTVTSDPAIASVTIDGSPARPGDTVTAQVALTGTVPAGARLTVEAIDNLGRTIARKYQTLRAGQLAAAVPFRVSNPLALSADVRVELRVGDALLDHEVAWLFTPIQRTRGQFAHAVWSADTNRNEFVRRLMYRQLRDQGVDMMTNSSRDPLTQAQSARNNFDTIPYATRYFYDGRELVRAPCLTDPEYLSAELGKLTDLGAALGPFRPRAWTLGDECFLARGGVDVCFSDTCVADLREWLRGEYATVADLNASWGTEYASFDETEPITLADAREADQPARWVDHRRHMEVVYARMMERARSAIRESVPDADVGFDGPFDTSSTSGNDWWKLMQVFDLCTLYWRYEEWEPVRSFADPGDLLGVWYGGYFEHRTEDEERLWPWKALLNGFNSMWWYAVYHGLSTCPMDALTPSMTVYPSFRQASEEIAELRAGPAQALMNATRLDDGVAVHYSQSSVHAATWDPTFGPLDRHWLATYQTLEDLGLQYDCYAYAQLEADGLDPARYPVFVMPHSQAISPREAQAIRRYVQDGGMVIADVQPGVCDQHGKPVSPGLLDDLFGIERIEGPGLLARAEGKITGLGHAIALPGIDVDGNARAAGAQALGSAGDAPLALVKQTGAGRTVLLNYSFGSIARARMEPAALAHREVVYALLAMANVTPQVQVTVGEEPLRGLETVRYADGPVQYLGFLKQRTSPEEPTTAARISTTERLHTWDLRTGEYLGLVDAWDAQFVPSRGSLFARLPYHVDGLRLSVTKGAVEANERERLAVVACTVRLLTGEATPGRQWVNLRLLGPDGVERRHYARNVAVEGGSAVSYVPMALSDEPGTWTVIARDVISGERAEASFALGG